MESLFHIGRTAFDASSAAPWVRVQPGEVWLVGAGPGHPGFLTVLGREILLQADVVVHDRLGCEEILPLLPRSVRLIDAGKEPGRPKLTQNNINSLLLDEARAGNRVVRLKGGDPFIFGRGMEELLFLRAEGINCRVVPGVSSAVASPACAEIPLTHRALARGFSVGTGHAEDGSTPPVNEGDTRVFLMSISALEKVLAQLTVSPDTPAAIVASATTHRERIIRGTVATIATICRAEEIAPPATLIVGATAGLSELQIPSGRRHLVVTSTRIPSVIAEREAGKPILWRPLHRMEPLAGADRDTSVAILRRNLQTRWIVFNNRYAVAGFIELLRATGLDARAIRAQFAAVGAEAAAELERYALIPNFVAVDGARRGVARQLTHRLDGSTVLFPCAEDYRGGLAEELRQDGHPIDYLPVYRRVAARPALVDWRFADEVLFASPAAVARFAEEFPDAPLAKLTATCIGESPARAALALGFGQVNDLTAGDDAGTQADEANTA